LGFNIYNKKNPFRMERPITKVELSITLDIELVNYIKENYKNRSKFIEYCIIEELKKFDKYKEKINIE
jgi:metal-responsive CopG/Arc/MetJ family transcriptional regulator